MQKISPAVASCDKEILLQEQKIENRISIMMYILKKFKYFLS